MFSPIIIIQLKGIVSSTKDIIETHISSERYYNYSERIIENTTIIFHYTTETMSRLTVTLMKYLKAGFR